VEIWEPFDGQKRHDFGVGIRIYQNDLYQRNIIRNQLPINWKIQVFLLSSLSLSLARSFMLLLTK